MLCSYVSIQHNRLFTDREAHGVLSLTLTTSVYSPFGKKKHIGKAKYDKPMWARFKWILLIRVIPKLFRKYNDCAEWP